MTDYGEDTPARIAKRLPAPQRKALRLLGDGELDCFKAGITQTVLRALRSKNLARTPDERHWFITPGGVAVLGLI